MEKSMFGISIDEALAKSQERLAEYTKNILEESDSFHAVESTKLREVIDVLKIENARLREALIFRGYDPDSELKYHEEEKQIYEILKGIE